MIKAVIFDMDGLIVDTEILETKAFMKILKDYGKKPIVNPDGLIHEIGGADGYYRRFKQKYGLSLSEEELKIKKRRYFEQLVKESNIKPFDGFFELLALLKQHHIKLALASNRLIHDVYMILEELKAIDYFNVIIGPNDGLKRKPHPDTYLETAKQLDIQPKNCLAFEDTNMGVVSAHAAGMKVIAVPNKYTKDHDFSHADKVVNSLKSVTIELINTI